jgi:hypothetical protein
MLVAAADDITISRSLARGGGLRGNQPEPRDCAYCSKSS